MVLLLVLFCSSVQGQDILAALEAIGKSLWLLTALEQNLALREAALIARESSLNQIELSLLAREAFLSETEKNLQEREQTLLVRENSLKEATVSFQTLEKAFKKQSWLSKVTKAAAWGFAGAAIAGWSAFAIVALQ